MNFYNITAEPVFEWGNSVVLTGWENYYVYDNILTETTKDNECIYTYDNFCNTRKSWCVENDLTYIQPCVDEETTENIIYQPKQKIVLNDLFDDELIVYQPKQRPVLNDLFDDELIVYQPKQITILNDFFEDEIIVYQTKHEPVLNDFFEDEIIVYQTKHEPVLNDFFEDENIVYQTKH